ncbi:uncharacterized protein LOC134542479 [Bacillus rossius redtenbacheri]|uniref:uncharacterized protein LOC134542479 n=1 Tax=Bacillus rossius redtenbacheri TaxID=93214 RepID=UPI002FDD796B
MTSVEEAHVKLREPIELLQNALKCVICLEDYKDPVLTRCEHLFCWECISRILKDRPGPRCPLCKKPVSRRGITRADHISHMIARFVDLRESIPKDTGFELESFLGLPTGAKEAPTNSPLTRKNRNSNLFQTQTIPQATVVTEQSEGTTVGSNTEENVVLSDIVLISDIEESEKVNPPKGKKFGRCYKRRSSDQAKLAQAGHRLWSEQGSVHSDVVGVRPKETDSSSFSSGIEIVDGIRDSDSLSSVQCLSSDSELASAAGEDVDVTTESGPRASGRKRGYNGPPFPFSYPVRKVRNQGTAFEKLMKKSSMASSQALSQGVKDSHGKKIFTCKEQPEDEKRIGKDINNGDDPYVFVSSQRTPHRVKYKKDGVKDLGKIGQPPARKNTTKRKQDVQVMKNDSSNEITGVSLLESGSQNFIESCPVDVNDDFDKLVIKTRQSVLQTQSTNCRFSEAPVSKNDTVDSNLDLLFRTPNNDTFVPESPAMSKESLVSHDKKRGHGKQKSSRKSLKMSNLCAAGVSNNSRTTKSLVNRVSFGKDEKPSLSQQVREIQQQFNDVDSHELSVEQKEAPTKRDTNKNILDLNVMGPEHVQGRSFQKSSNGTKRVSFADTKEPIPAAQVSYSVEKLSSVDISVIENASADNHPMSRSANSSGDICNSEVTTEVLGTLEDTKLSDTVKGGADVGSCEAASLKSALTFDLVGDAGSSVSSPGEPILGFERSPANGDAQVPWRTHTARSLKLLEESPGLKRKREDPDEMSDAPVAEIVKETVPVNNIGCNDSGAKIIVVDGDGIDVETPSVLDSNVSVALEDGPKCVVERPQKRVIKKMKHCKSYETLRSKPKGSSIAPNTPRVKQRVCNRATLTMVRTADVGTEVDLHLTSRPRARTRTYIEASVQTDEVDVVAEKRPVLTVDAQTSPIKPNLSGVEKSDTQLQMCEEPENTECVSGTFDEAVEDAAYLAENFSVLGAKNSSQKSLPAEESEKLEFSLLEDADVSVVHVAIGSSQLINESPPQKTKETNEIGLLSNKPSSNGQSIRVETFSQGGKDLQSYSGKLSLASSAAKAADKIQNTKRIDNSKSKGKGPVSFRSNKMSRKLSFSPNYVPTLSKEPFPLVLGTDSSESEEEFRTKRSFKCTRKSKPLSLSSDSDAEQQSKASKENCEKYVSNDGQDSIPFEDRNGLEVLPKAVSCASRPAVKLDSPPHSPAGVPGAGPAPEAAREPESSTALITPSLQALLQSGASQENTMEFLEGGEACRPATQHSAASFGPLDTQQLQNIDLAVIAAGEDLPNPQQSKEDYASLIDDQEMMYEDIIEPTPQKKSSFVSHSVSKMKFESSWKSKSVDVRALPQTQASRSTSETDERQTGAPGRAPLAGQRAPLQVVTNALPAASRPAADAQGKPLCLACSMLSGQSKFLVQKLVETFRLRFSPTYHAGVTHLLVPRTEESIQSVKYVFAVAEKKWVLYEDWVADSLQARVLLPEENYEVSEPVSGGPRRSRLSTEPLFKNYVMCFIPPLEAITKEQIEEVSALCGAEIVSEPALLIGRPGHTVLLLCNEKNENAALELFRKYKIPPISYYYVIDSISAHQLFDPFIYLITKSIGESIFRKFGYSMPLQQ